MHVNLMYQSVYSGDGKPINILFICISAKDLETQWYVIAVSAEIINH
jgi:hypothetical protein